MKYEITYTDSLKTAITEKDFMELLSKAQNHPAALNNLRAASEGGTSVRSFLADAAKISGSSFRPDGWM